MVSAQEMSVYKSLSIRPLTRELQNIAESELNETPQRVETDLQHIKDWLSKQSHLNCRTGKFGIVRLYFKTEITLRF